MPGPYIGPRGGEWADPAHTIPWDPVEVRPHPRLGMDAAPRRYHRVPTTDGRVRLVPERYAEEGLAGGPAMHQDSVEHFKADLEGRVVAPLTGRADVDAVLEGRAELLGKGDDGIAFRAGDKVVKVSTTVPYQPENGGHRSPQEAADMLAAQVAAGNALADLGLAVQRSELIRSGRKAFQVKAFVEIPERWTLDQLGTIRATLEGMHDAGWSLNDEVQAGIEPGGRIVLFDVGKASRSTGSGRDGSAARDLERLADLYHASGYSLREAAMTPRERVASAQIEDWRATPDAALLRDLTGARSVLVSARRVLEEEAAKRLAGDRLAARLDEIDLDLTFDVFRLEDLEATVNDAAGEVKKALAAARPVRPARSHVGLVAMALLAARVAEEEELFKGGAHRYIRKVPTGRVTKTGKPIHRYFYAVTGGAGLHRVQEEIRVGASFQGVVEDKKGHYHVVAAVAGERSTGGPDDRFNVVHDESGVHFQLTRAELADRLRVEHADPLAAVQERIRSNLAAAMGTGTERQIRRLRDLAEKYGVEPEELDTSIFKHHQTAENNPPSWQGLDLSVLPWVSTTRTWVDRYTGRQRSAPGWELNRRAGDERSQFLEDTGFFDVLFDPQKPNDQFRASLLRTLNEKPWEQLTDKQKEWGYKIIRDLTAWWTDLRDDDREKFWAEFLDQSKQTPLQARVADPAQENAELPPIAGLRKFHDRGFNLHEYQRKMVNWLADAAPRALIAAEMGLGKTICAVAAFEKLAERGEVSQMLVTAPLAAMGSWESHLAYTDRKVAILGGATAKQRKAAYDAFERGEIDVLVVSPDTMAEKSAEVKGGVKQTLSDALLKIVAKSAGGEPPEITVRLPGGRWDPPTEETWVMTEGWFHRADGSDGMPWETALRYIRERGGKVYYEDPDGDLARLRRITTAKGERCFRVADEIHNFKNGAAARTKGFRQIMTAPRGRVLGLTGTPKPNSPVDFFQVIDNISPGALGTETEFVKQYCFEAVGTYGKCESFRPERLGDMYRALSPVMMARTVADPDARIDLPERVDLAPFVGQDAVQDKIGKLFGHYAELRQIARQADPRSGMPTSDAMRAMDEIERALSGELGLEHRAACKAAPSTSQVALLRYQQLAIHPGLLDPEFFADEPNYESPKTAAVAEATMAHLATSPDQAAVLFCEFKGGLEAMRQALISRGLDPAQVAVYDGSLSPKRRRALEAALNGGSLKVLLGQTKALETGANLQKRASFVAHINTPWSPSTLVQSTARVYRQGQAQRVTVLRPVASEVEAAIESVVSRKVIAAAQATGAATDADKAAGRLVRSGVKDLDSASVAKLLGIDPRLFAQDNGGDDDVNKILD